jgi:hypothetical protein
MMSEAENVEGMGLRDRNKEAKNSTWKKAYLPTELNWPEATPPPQKVSSYFSHIVYKIFKIS